MSAYYGYDEWCYIKCGRADITFHYIDLTSHKYMSITVTSILDGCSYTFSLKTAPIIFMVAILICISVNST